MDANQEIFLPQRFQYVDQGSGEILVLLHGWMDTKEDWYFNYAFLVQHFRVITFDFPGCNRVDDFCDANLPGYIDFVTRFIDAIQIQSFYLMGHSLGASIALGYANQHPDRVKKLILLHIPLGEVTPLKRRLSNFLFASSRSGLMRSFARRLKIQPAYLNFMSQATAEKSSPNYQKSGELTSYGLKTSSPKAYLQGYSSILALNTKDDLEELDAKRIPYLLIHGKNDTLVDLQNAAKIPCIQNKLYLAENTRHCLNRENPAQFHTVIADFLG